MDRYNNIVLNQVKDCLLIINPAQIIVSPNADGSKVTHTVSKNVHYVTETPNEIQALIIKADKQK